LIAQALLFALISLGSWAIEARPAATRSIAAFDVQAPAEEPAEPAEPAVPAAPPPAEPVSAPESLPVVEPVADLAVQTQNPAVPAQPLFSALAAERAGFGTTCDVAETLVRAFAENESVKGMLARIGPQSRSVANAIMFWDAEWVELPGDAPKEAIDALRQGILEGVRAAPAECLAQDLAGPRFIFVGDTGSPTMLVIGSGTWRWEQLLAQADERPEAAAPTAEGRPN
jgi:hypothetical protein